MTVTAAYIRASRYFLPDLGKIIFSTLLIGVTTLSGLAQPFPMAILIDVVLMHKTHLPWPHRLFLHIAPGSVVGQIILLAVVTVVLRLTQELVGLWQAYYKIVVSYNGLRRVRCDLYRKLAALSLAYHRARPQGDAIYRISYDSIGIQNAFNVMQTTFVNAIVLVAMSAIMLTTNWKLGLIAMGVMPVLYVTINYYGKILTKSSRRTAEVDSELTSIVQRSVTAISLIQSFNREEHEFGRFNDSVGKFTRASIRMQMHAMLYWVAIGSAFAIGLGFIFGVGGYFIWKYPQFTVGDLLIFWQYMLVNLYDPIFKLSGAGAEMRKNLAGMSRVYEVLDTPTDIKDAPDAISLEVEPRLLEFSHVSFAYGDGPPVLKDLSVTIRPGEMVAFVGPSGDPASGEIRLGDHDIRQIKLRDLRRHIALVLQDALILPTSVAENIAYGKPEATAQQIRRAAELSGANAFIEALPQQYDTVLNEGGNNLSGGQRQRLSIARALDEPTSALDPQNERMITETLQGLKRQRTMILVSHRLSTVSDCDRIYVMDAGRIIEQGTHEELIAQGGAYYKMARHQMKVGEVVST
jgi:subfamily B ATP-binding cassette protein MsbA